MNEKFVLYFLNKSNFKVFPSTIRLIGRLSKVFFLGQSVKYKLYLDYQFKRGKNMNI